MSAHGSERNEDGLPWLCWLEIENMPPTTFGLDQNCRACVIAGASLWINYASEVWCRIPAGDTTPVERITAAELYERARETDPQWMLPPLPEKAGADR